MPITIELVGVDPVNKGALLMFEAALCALRTAFPDARFATSFRMPRQLRSMHGVWGVLPRDKSRWPVEMIWQLIPARLKGFAGLIDRREIDVIVDLSGYAYGDDWPEAKLKNRLIEPLDQQVNGRPKLILLPQAFGPFQTAKHARLMAGVLARADLIYARDEVSLSHLEKLVPSKNERIRMAPDFTNLLDVLPAHQRSDRAIVIPNVKLLKNADAKRRETYLIFLEQCISQFRSGSLDPEFLIHEGDDDRAIAEEVNDRLSKKASIYIPRSAIDAKAHLASSHCVVSSRYHGLVSALSTGVPALACGWSHKYDALMRDYGLPEMLVNLSKPESWHKRISTLIEIANSQQATGRLKDRAATEKARSTRMWNEVTQEISKCQV